MMQICFRKQMKYKKQHKKKLIVSRERPRVFDILAINSCHVECVVGLHRVEK